jgi:hypothetical protein
VFARSESLNSILGGRYRNFEVASFAGAFGRRRLSYCRLEQFVPGGRLEPGSGAEPSSVCPEGYVLSESTFSDGGLFDNLPIGLARMLAERHVAARSNPLPVSYIYLEPNRLRYDEPEPIDPRACDLPDPPEACGLLAYDLSSEAGMLFGALGAARTFERLMLALASRDRKLASENSFWLASGREAPSGTVTVRSSRSST